MDFLYHMIKITKNQIRMIDQKHIKEYINIIKRWRDNQMDKNLYLADKKKSTTL